MNRRDLLRNAALAIAFGVVRASGAPWGGGAPEARATPIYHLARDFAQTLLAHAGPPGYRRDEFLAAVKHNLEHGEDFSAWSLA